MFSVLLISIGGSAFFVVQRSEGTTREDGAGRGQLTWVALRETIKGSWRDAIHAEHAKMNNTPMRSGQDPDEHLERGGLRPCLYPTYDGDHLRG